MGIYYVNQHHDDLLCQNIIFSYFGTDSIIIFKVIFDDGWEGQAINLGAQGPSLSKSLIDLSFKFLSGIFISDQAFLSGLSHKSLQGLSLNTLMLM